ncbi:AMP-binding protein [Sciscionella marina]|uniref:AMP-binding protein n=1 Tax=Sciscionella marina TaxID=508770 RepID=UPI00037A849C|nr:AMP-binding protein [Sciscionella marina]
MIEAHRQTLTKMLTHQAERTPERVALTIVDQDVSYADLVARSNAMARGLRALGIGQEDVVASLAANSIDQVALEFACARLRAIEVMLNTAYRGQFLTHQLNVSGAQLIIVDAHLVPAVLDVIPDVPSLQHVIVRDHDIGLPNAGPVNVLGIAELRSHSSDDLTDQQDPLWTDPVSIQFTSGTTGPSKGAVLSQNYLCTFARTESDIWYRGPEDTFYSCGPLFHLAAKGICVLGSISRGVRCVQDERFSVSRFWERVRTERCNVTLMLGSMATLLWTREPSEVESIDTVVCIPAPPATLQEEMSKRWNCRFESDYGLSEAAPLTRSGPDTPLRAGSAGKIVSEYFDVHIVDDDDLEVPADVVGEVVVRPREPHVMFDGYYHNPAATVEKYRNLWFHTGDLGRLDEDGYFYFVDRKDDYLRRRGENISSHEVEAAIARHPDIIETAVVGVASDLLEQEVKAAVVLQPGAQVNAEHLVRFCIEVLPYFAVPRYVQFLDDLPRTPSGKVEKHKLRVQGIDECWDRERAGIILSGKRSTESVTRPVKDNQHRNDSP